MVAYFHDTTLAVLAQKSPSTAEEIHNSTLAVEINSKNGSYTIRSKDSLRVAVTASVAARINQKWIRSSDYPSHSVQKSSFSENKEEGSQATITHSGLPGQPDLVTTLRLHSQPAYAEVMVQVRNSTNARVTVQSIRVLDGSGASCISLDGPPSADRVLSDSFSEDRPNMQLHDLAQASDDHAHRAVGSQLIYNRQSHQSLFVGTLTSERWLTVLRLRLDEKQAAVAAYEVDSTGTTELAKENSLRSSPPQDQIELSIPVDAGQSLASERLMVSLSSNYHAQLESYGALIRDLHHARVNAPTPIGWWSWTAYYFGITESAALTNAEFQAAHLKDSGYNFFHIDEGYQFARGDYTSPVAYKFPHGVKQLEDKVRALGLTPGIWTAPFEVAERSSVYLNHKDWLVHNAHGDPIHAGFVLTAEDAGRDLDPLYVLDSTNPGAQQYLRETYSTLTRGWGIRYIKLDFMDDTAIEGYYYKPGTTALEAQRIGLQVIRDAVGEDVLLDKDGSPMLNPVGLVDTGRISCDTGHSFDATRDAAPGVAARYYMNRNFFVSDPDAFTVSRQIVREGQSRGTVRPLTLEEAKVSIALSAVSGGMFELGDDLPTLFSDADRMALVTNRDLINMARFAHAATPVDLMSYGPEDEMPSIFFLRESRRQSVLTIFNWTGKERKHEIPLSSFGLSARSQIVDLFTPQSPIAEDADSVFLTLSPHSVRIVKILDSTMTASAPAVAAKVPDSVKVGQPATLSADADSTPAPAMVYHWNFGDGTSADGASVTHTYTHAATFNVHLKVEGIEGPSFEKDYSVSATGAIDTVFRPDLYQRYEEKR